MLLNEKADDDQGDDGDRRKRRLDAVLLPRGRTEIFGELDRYRFDVRIGQHQGEQKLAPVENKDE